MFHSFASLISIGILNAQEDAGCSTRRIRSLRILHANLAIFREKGFVMLHPGSSRLTFRSCFLSHATITTSI